MSSSSEGLSPASAARLRRQLTTLAHDRVFPLVVETALYAIFTVLVATSTYIFCKRGLRHSWSNRVMLAATLAMYALSTLDWAIDVRLLWNDLRTLRFVGLPDAPPGRFGRSSPPLLVIQGITSVVCIILGDAVVCWRVCVVWAGHKGVVAAALFWVIGSIGVFTTFSVMFVGFYYPGVPPSVKLLVRHSEIVNAFSFSWSAATNVWATAMIAYKAWLQRRSIDHHLRSRTSTSTAVQKVLMLLVDLGIVYTIFMLLNVIVLIPSLNSGTFFFYVTLFMQQITGMYPTAIIVLVALQKSHLDHQFTYPPPPASETDSLPFTVNVQDATYASTGMGKGHESGSQVQLVALHDPKRTTSTAGPEEYSVAVGWEREREKESGQMGDIVGVAT
ncbi:hypothetical protein C8Q76DRAFT_765465 [Earliella scabrosa]|nr:hypothetical protein C8Q76DRAFT_765465 [Earliella scabrosa]